MSEDEMFAGMVCAIFSLLAWTKWIYQASFMARVNSDPTSRSLLLVTPILAVLILFGVLKAFASHDVRNSPVYLPFYMIMGAAWVGLARYGLHLFNLSARDDVVERHNRAAAYAIAGGLLGLTFCFAGGNIGDGPGWWVVIFASTLSTVAFFIVWIVLHCFTGLAESVTVDRDSAAGLRLGAFFVAVGLILGRAVAGNWVSAEATVSDFLRVGWPALLLLVVAVPIERALRPSAHRPTGDKVIHGLAPGLFYILFGIVAVLLRGKW